MARMMARQHALGPGGINCRCCGALTVGARAREKRDWLSEAEKDLEDQWIDAYWTDD